MAIRKEPYTSAWAWAEKERTHDRTPTWQVECRAMPTQAATPSLTKMIVALPVVARHVGAAAPVPLADTALVQRMGGEEHSVTANGLQEARGEAAGALGLVQGRLCLC